MFTQNRVAELPGYTRAHLQVIKDNSVVKILGFAISPNSLSVSHSNIRNVTQTNAGWFTQHGGRNMISVGFNGYMLDVKNQTERHDFIQNYKKYIEDYRNDNLEHKNLYTTKLTIEGREYSGIVTDISFQKSGTQPYLYQYQISYTAFSERQIYNPAISVSNNDYLSQKLPEAPKLPDQYIIGYDDYYMPIYGPQPSPPITVVTTNQLKSAKQAFSINPVIGYDDYYNPIYANNATPAKLSKSVTNLMNNKSILK